MGVPHVYIFQQKLITVTTSYWHIYDTLNNSVHSIYRVFGFGDEKNFLFLTPTKPVCAHAYWACVVNNLRFGCAQ